MNRRRMRGRSAIPPPRAILDAGARSFGPHHVHTAVPESHLPEPAPRNRTATERFHRVLGLGDLLFYGIVIIQPVAAVTLFGIAEQLSGGHTVDTVLASMIPVLLTAVSYGRLAALYPAAGSAYTYTAQAINPLAGFVAGWAMLLGYLFMPLINVIYGAVTLRREFPWLPYEAAAFGFAFAFTALNLRGIRWTARANQIMLAVMCSVIGCFAVSAVIYLHRGHGWAGVFSAEPFYNPHTFSLRAMATATAFAALTYIGFDSVTTLAEDVRNPRRNVLLAVVLVVIITAGLSGAQVYLGHEVWPNYTTYPNVETAFMDVYRRVGGPLLFHAMGAVLIIACFAAALSGQVAAARILYGMGRDGVLPASFARLSTRRNTPAFGLIVIGVAGFALAGVLDFERAAEVLNAGALLAFAAVNLAAFWQFFVRSAARRLWRDAAAPLGGLVSCLAIWASLPRLALTAGAVWLAFGVVLGAVKARNVSVEDLAADFSTE